MDMEISYKLTEEDYLDFNLNHGNNSPSIKKSILIQRLMGPVIFFMASFLTAKRTGIPLWYWFILFGIVSIIWYAFYPKYINWEVSRRTLKMLKEGNNKNILEERTITLTAEGIKETSLNKEERVAWESIEKIEETQRNIYVYLSSISAFIIPIRAFKDIKSKNEFIEEINKHRENK